MKLEPLPLSPDAGSVHDGLPALAACLGGRRAVLPVSADGAGRELARIMDADGTGPPEPPGTLVACTSGSTGTPKGARLRAANLRASADATTMYLRGRFGTGPGPWLLALPPHHIAGVQVILRSLHAGYPPAVLEKAAGFTPDAFARATSDFRATRSSHNLYTSLVPTQLARLLADPEGTAALHEYAAILVGGAATAPGLVDQCHAAGIRIVRTYGSSETAGGMVYDGTAIPGSSVGIENADDHGTGRVLLSGPTVADGYRSADPAVASDAFPESGVFRTSDIGRIDNGVLTVLGRADGAINSGGLKILPEEVERALARVGMTACVVGVPDSDWGEIVAAAVEDSAGAGRDVTSRVRSLLRGAGTEPHLIPRRAVGVRSLPLTGPGKLDRQAVRRQLATRLGA